MGNHGKDERMSTDFENAVIEYGKALNDATFSPAKLMKLRSELSKIIESEFGPGEFASALRNIVAWTAM